MSPAFQVLYGHEPLTADERAAFLAAYGDPQVLARGMRIDLPRAEAEAGHVPTVRTPILIDGVPQVSRRPSPILGEHTREILEDPNWK